MKLHVAGLVGVMLVAALSVGCGLGKTEAKAPVSTTSLTSAPLTPDPLFPVVIWDEDEDSAKAATPAPQLVETWGVRAPTPEELEKYGF